MELAIDRLYKAFRFLLDWIIGYSAAFVMLATTTLAITETIRRYIFKTTFHWGQDAVIYGLVSAVFLYFAVTHASRSHLVVMAAVDELRKRGYNKIILVLRAFISALSMSVFAALAWWGIPTMERSMMMERTTQSMVLEIWPFQLALIIGFALMAISSLFHLYQDIQAVRGKTVFEWSPVEEGIDI